MSSPRHLEFNDVTWLLFYTPADRKERLSISSPPLEIHYYFRNEEGIGVDLSLTLLFRGLLPGCAGQLFPVPSNSPNYLRFGIRAALTLSFRTKVNER